MPGPSLLWGTVDDNGFTISGASAALKQDTGRYGVTFQSAMSNTPVVICTQLYYNTGKGGDTTDNVVVNSVDVRGFSCSTGDNEGNRNNRLFSWIAVSREEAWITYGTVANNARQSGSNFTLNRLGTGHYKVTFAHAFASTPAVLAQQIHAFGGNTLDNAIVWNITTTSFEVFTGDSGGNYNDRSFGWVAATRSPDGSDVTCMYHVGVAHAATASHICKRIDTGYFEIDYISPAVFQGLPGAAATSQSNGNTRDNTILTLVTPESLWYSTGDDEGTRRDRNVCVIILGTPATTNTETVSGNIDINGRPVSLRDSLGFQSYHLNGGSRCYTLIALYAPVRGPLSIVATVLLSGSNNQGGDTRDNTTIVLTGKSFAVLKTGDSGGNPSLRALSFILVDSESGNKGLCGGVVQTAAGTSTISSKTCIVTRERQGTYRVSYLSPYYYSPAVVAKQFSDGNTTDNAVIIDITNEYFRCITGDNEGNLSDRNFCFLIGGDTSIANRYIMAGSAESTGGVLTGDVDIDRVNVGLYKVTFHNPFLEFPPAVVVGQHYIGPAGSSTLDNATLTSNDAGSFQCKTGDSGGSANDRAFSFVAVETQAVAYPEVTITGDSGYIWCALSKDSGMKVCTVPVPANADFACFRFQDLSETANAFILIDPSQRLVNSAINDDTNHEYAVPDAARRGLISYYMKAPRVGTWTIIVVNGVQDWTLIGETGALNRDIVQIAKRAFQAATDAHKAQVRRALGAQQASDDCVACQMALSLTAAGMAAVLFLTVGPALPTITSASYLVTLATLTLGETAGVWVSRFQTINNAAGYYNMAKNVPKTMCQWAGLCTGT